MIIEDKIIGSLIMIGNFPDEIKCLLSKFRWNNKEKEFLLDLYKYLKSQPSFRRDEILRVICNSLDYDLIPSILLSLYGLENFQPDKITMLSGWKRDILNIILRHSFFDGKYYVLTDSKHGRLYVKL